MIRVSHLDHLVLTVKDIDNTVRFYVNVLGMEKEVFKGNRVALTFGNQKINLHQLGAEFEPKAKHVQDGSADVCLIIHTPIVKAKEYIENLGIEIEEGPVERTGAKGVIESIYIRDPDENLIELSNYK